MSDDDEFNIWHRVMDNQVRIVTVEMPSGQWRTDLDVNLATLDVWVTESRWEAVLAHRKGLRAAGPYLVPYADKIYRGHVVAPAEEVFGYDFTPQNRRPCLITLCGNVFAPPADEKQTNEEYPTCIICLGIS